MQIKKAINRYVILLTATPFLFAASCTKVNISVYKLPLLTCPDDNFEWPKKIDRDGLKFSYVGKKDVPDCSDVREFFLDGHNPSNIVGRNPTAGGLGEVYLSFSKNPASSCSLLIAFVTHHAPKTEKPIANYSDWAKKISDLITENTSIRSSGSPEYIRVAKYGDIKAVCMSPQ